MQFRTEHGSVYTHHVRIKFDGTTHKRGRTIFVSDLISDVIVSFLQWHNNSGERCIITMINNNPCVVVINTRTGKVVDKLSRIIKSYETVPVCGTCPIEIEREWFHIGHKVIGIV